MEDVILRLDQAQRDRQGNWIFNPNFVISYEKMIRLAKDAGYDGNNIEPNNDYITVCVSNGTVTTIHYDKFTDLEYVEEVSNDRIGE